MAANIFIDTNIFLSFYDISDENLNELSKIADSLNEGEIVLFLPEQVEDEFQRNREAKVANAMRNFSKHKFKVSFPRMCVGYPEYQEMQSLIQDLTDSHTSLINALRRDILEETLRADEVIGRIFGAAQRVEMTASLLDNARNRMELGKPPGKSGSLGDAINWEALLATVPNEEPLYIISRDGDFSSPLDDERIDPYLAKEWYDSKLSEVHCYKKLTGVFKKIDVSIQLSVDISRLECIEDLENSFSFHSTHLAIGRLSEFESEFSRKQLNRLLCILPQNEQVSRIIGDVDVRDFYSDLVANRFDDIYRETLEEMEYWLSRTARDVEEDSWDNEELTQALQWIVQLNNMDPSAAMSEKDEDDPS